MSNNCFISSMSFFDRLFLWVKAAINAVTASGGQKTIKLLKNVQLKESLTIATGKDIVNLINYVKEKVKEKYNIELIEEQLIIE